MAPPGATRIEEEDASNIALHAKHAQSVSVPTARRYAPPLINQDQQEPVLGVHLQHGRNSDRGARFASPIALRYAPPIRPVSTVGAEDSFLGTMISRLASGHGVVDALRYGVAAGSAALLSPGTELSRPPDTERLLREVEIREIPLAG